MIQACIFLLLILIPTDQQTEIQRILQHMNREVKSIEILSYDFRFQMTTSPSEDSIYNAVGKIWLQRLPNDTIFGCRFHLQGEDKNDRFDYYFDGQNSFEIRHKEQIVTIFNPCAFPNDYRNPAKSRVALMPFQFTSYLVDTNILSTLRDKATAERLLNESQSGRCTIAFDYEDAMSKTTKNISIDTSTFHIKKIETKIVFRGMAQTTTVEISNYKKNDSSQLPDIYLINQFEGYKKEYVPAKDTLTKITKRNTLIGKKAPLFSAPSYSGNTISLGQMKGKIVLLDFWESSCGYCLFAFPKVNELQQKYLKDHVQVVGVSSQNRSIIMKLIESNKLNYENMFTNKKVIAKYHISAWPTYVLIDRDGRIVDVSEGNLEKIEQSLQMLLK